MNRTIGAPRIAAVLLAASALSGCSLFGGKVDMSMSKAMKQKCPPVGIVAYTGQVTRFNGSGEEASDMTVRAELDNLKVTCTNNADNTAVSAHITFDLSGERGPASNDSGVTLQYFVALTADSKSVLEKKLYDSTVSFGENGEGVTHEALDATVPIKGDELPYEEILIGLQLDRHELGYNIARAASR
ncbi:MAG: hypothetical protein GC201_02835 [Alphaproteobacteria bacterium]|nr:hypothetical protein [Alphaproteobacteria bacterium]